MRFDLFSSTRLYEAMKEAGYPDLPQPRTLRDWIKKDSAPEGARRFVAEHVLGTTKDAPPAEADGAMLRAFIEHWAGDDPPPWAKALTQSILNAIDRDRRAFLDQAAAQYSELAALLNGLGNDDGAPPGSTGPQPKRPGPRRGPSA